MTDDVKAVVERLTDDLQEGRINDLAISQDLRALLSAHRKMVEALEPFDRFLGTDGGEWPDDSSVAEYIGKGGLRVTLTFGDLRRARAALTGSREQ